MINKINKGINQGLFNTPYNYYFWLDTVHAYTNGLPRVA